VEPQQGLEALAPQELCRTVLARGSSAVPAPWLRENTLVLSSSACVAPRGGGLYLSVRCGAGPGGRPCALQLGRWGAAAARALRERRSSGWRVQPVGSLERVPGLALPGAMDGWARRRAGRYTHL
jgi:hypothetical protein